MAKVPFSKLEAKLNSDIENISFLNSKGEEVSIEVKYYLPVEEKMEMISKIINQSLDDNGFYNPMRVKIFTTLEMVYAYTNLSFTTKQKENPLKLYDSLVSTGIFQEIISHIFEEDWKEIQETILKVMENIYKYKNSAMGIMEAITSDYSNLNLEATDIQKTLADPDNMSLLRDILSQLG